MQQPNVNSMWTLPAVSGSTPDRAGEEEADDLIGILAWLMSIHFNMRHGDQYDLSNRIGLGEFALPNWPTEKWAWVVLLEWEC